MLSTAQANNGLVLTGHQVGNVGIGLGLLALVIVLMPALLAVIYAWNRPKDASGGFFEVPYITWFLVHYGIAALAIIAIVFLGVDNVIDKGTVSALLGSLFGYVLGSAAHGSRPSPSDQQPGRGRDPSAGGSDASDSNDA
jgi:hypothetical protein